MLISGAPISGVAISAFADSLGPVTPSNPVTGDSTYAWGAQIIPLRTPPALCPPFEYYKPALKPFVPTKPRERKEVLPALWFADEATSNFDWPLSWQEWTPSEVRTNIRPGLEPVEAPLPVVEEYEPHPPPERPPMAPRLVCPAVPAPRRGLDRTMLAQLRGQKRSAIVVPQVSKQRVRIVLGQRKAQSALALGQMQRVRATIKRTMLRVF